MFFFNYINAQDQNALMQSDLIMYDRIPLDSTHYSKGEDDYNLFYKKLIYKNKILNKINIKKLITDHLLIPETDIYKDYSPYEKNIRRNLLSLKYSSKDIRKQLGESIDTMMTYDPDIGEFTENIIKNEIDTAEITGILFYDTWLFDEEKFKMYKEVKAYSPIRTYFRPDDPGKIMPVYKMIGWLTPDSLMNKRDIKNSDKRMKLFCNVTYEYYINNIELGIYRIDENLMSGLQLEEYLQKHECIFWTKYAKEKFKHLIIDDVIKGKREGFDFQTRKLLKTEDCKERIGIYMDSIYIPDIETGELAVNKFEKQLDYSEIKSFIFIENWYVDKVSLRIKKEVSALAPVRTYYSEDDFDRNKPIKIIPFLIILN